MPLCPMKQQCCPNTSHRKIARSVHEDAREVARKIADTPEYRESRCERKRSRCCLRISNAFFASTAYDCGDSVVPTMNFCWPRQLRTSGNSPNCVGTVRLMAG